MPSCSYAGSNPLNSICAWHVASERSIRIHYQVMQWHHEAMYWQSRMRAMFLESLFTYPYLSATIMSRITFHYAM